MIAAWISKLDGSAHPSVVAAGVEQLDSVVKSVNDIWNAVRRRGLCAWVGVSGLGSDSIALGTLEELAPQELLAIFGATGQPRRGGKAW